MSEVNKREAIKAAYKGPNGKPSSRWVARVSKMSDDQVTAIYLRLKAQNKV